MKDDIKSVSLPITMDLQRTNKPIEVTCVTADGDGEGKILVEPHLNEYGGVKGAVLGLGIGWAYDRLTDAVWDYPSEIVVPVYARQANSKKE